MIYYVPIWQKKILMATTKFPGRIQIGSARIRNLLTLDPDPQHRLSRNLRYRTGL
jgi:hypothetical protein